MYPGMAKSAREEGFDDIAEWFETLAKAEKSHAGRFTKMLDAARELRRRPGGSASAEAPRALSAVWRAACDARRMKIMSEADPAPKPPANDPERLARYWDDARPRGRDAARLRGLPRLPHVRELLRLVPGPVRARRPRHREARRRRAPSCSTTHDFTIVDRPLLAVQALLHQVPVHAPTRSTSGSSTSRGS